MKKAFILFFSACLFFIFPSFAQDSSQLNNPEQQQETVLEKVDVEAKFTGEGGWTRFVQQNLSMEGPMKRNAPKGTYQVVVQFVIDTEGRITQIKPLTNFGYGMEDEVVRIIKKSRKQWQPAMQNGIPVKAYRKQPITFVIPG